MHRNNQKRNYNDNIYFITCNTQDKICFFEDEKFCKIWINTLKNIINIKWCEIFAFCLNYDHFHLLIKPNNNLANISKVIQSLKRNSSRDINKLIELETNPFFSKFQWQKSFHDHIIRDKEDFLKHLKYTENNYIKHWLPNDWEYTNTGIIL